MNELGRLEWAWQLEVQALSTRLPDRCAESLEEGDVGPANPDTPRPVAVAFELDEAPRYQLSYGGRWESDVGLGGVVDLVNRNSLGRGHRTGVRAIINDDVRSLRLYHVIPQPLPSERSSLELFVEGKRENVEDVRSDVIEAWAQLTFPLTDRMLTRGSSNTLNGCEPGFPQQCRAITFERTKSLAEMPVRRVNEFE